eukprot:CAMPEP_0182880820 /NCGR_PEP_ID=MMETSP0034_2-20130328/16796_1 /TAXON_ID=156128 /ORGANISM="Nephroselmis pyriformis, Strain CCMP717" /LENGTH=47 /DNA_ID= /DNA_START= /DNA_END= /DNA_ORIENTATION=
MRTTPKAMMHMARVKRIKGTIVRGAPCQFAGTPTAPPSPRQAKIAAF